MENQRSHPYHVEIAGDDDMDDVNNVNNNNLKRKSVNKTIGTRSKMKAGSAISSTATLNNLLGDAGKRSAQMPVRFANHETSHTLGKRKSSAATNNAPKSTTFYHHDAEAHASNTTKKNRNTEKVLPLSQSQTTPPPIPIITSNEQTNISFKSCFDIQMTNDR